MQIIKPSFEIEADIDGTKLLKKIERIGRKAYKSEGFITEDSYKAFIEKLLKLGHLSVLEHVSVSVDFVCDRGVSHELVRHRHASITQESTRYCNYNNKKFGGEITVILPFWYEGVLDRNVESFREDEKELFYKRCRYNHWFNVCKEAEEHYNLMISHGAQAQEARNILPHSLKTELTLTCNLREWGHIFYLRTASEAHPQMQQIMKPLLVGFQILFPGVFDALDVYKEKGC